MRLMFSINEYDYEGDAYRTGMYLHIDDHIRLRFKNPIEMKEFGERISALAVSDEVTEVWQSYGEES